jgi:hypothetical protein
MTLHLSPETEAKLTAIAAAHGVSADAYLEMLVEKELSEASLDERVSDQSQFQKGHGIWVYRTGDPMPPSLVEDTLDAIWRERETSIFGNVPSSLW